MSKTNLDISKARKIRSVLRTSFTRIANELEAFIEEDSFDSTKVRSKLSILEGKINEIKTLDKTILDILLDDEIDESELDKEIKQSDDYLEKYNQVKLTTENRLGRIRLDSDSPLDESVSNADRLSLVNEKKKLRLPVIELTKFSGQLKEWLPFWAQFKRIDEDEAIDDIDKYHYLIQATVPNSRARQIVESYPATAENYRKSLNSLKVRFGREDMLIDVYVRELLKLVLSNVDSKIVLSNLFDKLESQMRALDTLGVTTDKCAAMLYPLVESCLPEDLLRAWQRHTSYEAGDDMKDRLDSLMKFLQREVANEERIALAVSGFSNKTDSHSKKLGKSVFKPKPSNDKEYCSTASDLINQNRQDFGKQSPKCIFCSAKHLTENCDNSFNLSLEDKIKLLSKSKCCFKCTKYGHTSKQCRVKLFCSICKGRHMQVMCNTKSDENTCKSVKNENVLANNIQNEVFLQTLVVQMKGKNKERAVRAIIDTGSQRSYILKETAVEMEYVPLRKINLVHNLFGGSNTDTVEHTCYRARLGNLDDTYSCNFEVLDQNIICNNVVPIRQGPWMIELQRLGVRLTDTSEGPIEVLIGADVAGKLLTDQRKVLDCGLVAVGTHLGWTLIGKTPSVETQQPNSFISVTTSMLINENSIANLWELDTLGIKDPVQSLSKAEEESELIKHFNSTVSKTEDGRYEVYMPWIEGHPPLPTNVNVAKRRLESTVNKLKRNNSYDEYDAILKEWERDSIIEEIPLTDDYFNEGHYLPHRPVYKLNSTTRVRPVFDASAREYNQPSLNDCLNKGINLIELIPSIILRFRLNEIGVISDIKKAFLQISLSESDRDFVKFLWLNENGQLKVYRHTRVVFGVSCSPFLLGAVINHHLEATKQKCTNSSSQTDLIEQLQHSFYVDNCITSVTSEDHLNMFITESSKLFAEAKLELRGWEFSDKNLPVDIPPTSVLGMLWDKRKDSLKINMDNLRCENSIGPVTKRKILSVTHKIFDVLGISCPTTVYPKILLQRTWESKLKWDEEVTPEISISFLKWFEELPYLADIEVPRWFSGNVNSWSLHVFCDASQAAYAAVIFLRAEINHKVVLHLLAAKSRVAPVKKLSIPRLELLAAAIGARLASSVVKSLNVGNTEIVFWSDSTTSISWIQREDRWTTFVWNRAQEIRALTSKDAWRHVPGHLNPADLASRGCSPKELQKSKWWEGPNWLRQPEDQWPNSSLICDEAVINKEKRKSIVSSLITTENNGKDWYYSYFSKYEKILRLVGWISRFRNNCSNANKTSGPLTVNELEKAEIIIVKMMQLECFCGVTDKKLDSLCILIDENGAMRLKTKLTERSDSVSFRFPFILPSKHPVIRMLIQDYHEKYCHLGVQGLLCKLREKFWILNARKTIRSVIGKCVICLRQKSKKFEAEPVCLPRDRVRDSTAFEVSGVDFAGPLFTRTGEKAYICLFTCAIYRSIHLELVSSLSTEEFILAIRRFIARRGRPAVIYSDNGTNFVGTVNALKEVNWERVNEYSTVKRFEWRFNPPTAAWWGGWWERLIGLTKQLLRRTLGNALLSYEELYTVMCDCESILNSRPITYISEDATDLIPITPAMFLGEAKEFGTPDLDFIESKPNMMSRRLRFLQKLRDDIRARFRNEYLGQLILKSKKTTRSIKKGEVVLVETEKKKRLSWPLAIVEDIVRGKDGNIRVVKLRTKSNTLLRPIQKVYPLEVQHDNLMPKPSLLLEKECREKENVVPLKDLQKLRTKRGRNIKRPVRYCQ